MKSYITWMEVSPTMKMKSTPSFKLLPSHKMEELGKHSVHLSESFLPLFQVNKQKLLFLMFALHDTSALKPFSFLIHPPPTNTLLHTLRLMAFYKVENNFFSYRSSISYCIYLQLHRVINKRDSWGKIILLLQYLHIFINYQ